MPRARPKTRKARLRRSMKAKQAKAIKASLEEKMDKLRAQIAAARTSGGGKAKVAKLEADLAALQYEHACSR